LDVSWVMRLTNDVLCAVLRACVRIIQLKCEGCKNLNDGSVKLFPVIAPSLRVFNAAWCDYVSDDSLRAFVKAVPGAVAVNYYNETVIC